MQAVPPFANLSKLCNVRADGPCHAAGANALSTAEFDQLWSAMYDSDLSITD